MRRIWLLIPILTFAACAARPQRPSTAHAPYTSAPTLRSTIVGDVLNYTVQRGDTLSEIGSRFAVDVDTLASRNGISVRSRLRPGQILRVDNRHIVPNALEDGILINIPQRLLFHFEAGRLAGWYPVGLGQPGGWRTPTGSYRVVTRENDPVWDVPVSIQREMRLKGERVRKKVPPGPDNPLGRHWLGLSLTCCGIHGTNAPQSVYRFQTHGCIRLRPEHSQELFSRVEVGLPVEIVYEPVLVARAPDGNMFLEVHPDVYRRDKGDRADLAEAVGREAVGSRWKEVLRAEEGLAVPLSSPRTRIAYRR